MVNRKERIKMNMIGGYIDGSVSGRYVYILSWTEIIN